METIGHIDPDYFNWPVTKEEAMVLLQEFIQFRLLRFGDYQDAMTVRDSWLFHSRLSFVLKYQDITSA